MTDQPQLVDQQIIVSRNGKTLLSPFGSRRELREMADRIQKTVWLKVKDETRKLAINEAMQLAEVSLSFGLLVPEDI